MVIFGEHASVIEVKILVVLLIAILTWVAQWAAGVFTRWGIHFIANDLKLFRNQESLKKQVGGGFVEPVRVVILLIGIRLITLVAAFGPTLDQGIRQVLDGLLIVTVIWLIYRTANIILNFYTEKAAKGETALDETLVRFGHQLVLACILLLGVGTILGYLGIDIGTFVGGLGIVTVGVALAAQDTLGNLIGYTDIIADTPFKVGDVVTIIAMGLGNIDGRIESINFRSTRIRTFTNSLMVVPNKTVTTSNIVNWTHISKRQFEMLATINHTFDAEQLEAALQTAFDEIQTLLRQQPSVTGDAITFKLEKLHQNALDVVISCQLKVTHWEDFQSTKIDLQLKIMEVFNTHNFTIA